MTITPLLVETRVALQLVISPTKIATLLGCFSERRATAIIIARVHKLLNWLFWKPAWPGFDPSCNLVLRPAAAIGADQAAAREAFALDPPIQGSAIADDPGID
jgi:hypothetical protein